MDDSYNELKIPVKDVYIIAIGYLILPIIIFFFGWLKLIVAVIASLLLIYCAYKFINMVEDINGYIMVNKKAFICMIVVISIWVLTSGIGGFWVQRWDHHARNAVLRDLIDYSWPVIYPETGNALVYYFVYYMIPALAGKLFGWHVANCILALWSIIGIVLAMLFVCKYLNIHSLREISLAVVVLLVWGGLCVIAMQLMDVLGWGTYGLGGGYGWTNGISDSLGANYGYQYTPNTGLIKWVYNQTIVPWLSTAIFLCNKSKISAYAFLGLIILPYAPFPFIGMFVLMVALAFVKGRETSFVKVIKESISMCNILSIVVIVPIFYLFFQCNVAAGSFGLYTPVNLFTLKRLMVLLLFYFIQFGVYSILIYKQYKSEPLFWIINISLMVLPLFKVGTSGDFGWRSSTPGLFILMIMVIQYILEHRANDVLVNVRLSLLIVMLSFSSLSALEDYFTDFKEMRLAGQCIVLADDVKTFSTRPVYGDPEVFYTINYLVPEPNNKAFFKYIAR